MSRLHILAGSVAVLAFPALGLGQPAEARTIFVSNERGNSISIVDGETLVFENDLRAAAPDDVAAHKAHGADRLPSEKPSSGQSGPCHRSCSVVESNSDDNNLVYVKRKSSQKRVLPDFCSQSLCVLL